MNDSFHVHDMPVQFSLKSNNDVAVCFGSFSGTLSELQDFRKSFDYGCYKFGTGRFTSAHWVTIHADDFDHCKYPSTVGIKNEHSIEITLTWQELNELISQAMLFAIKHNDL